MSEYFTQKCLIPNMTKEEATKAYDELGPSYDEYIAKIQYIGPGKTAEIAAELFPGDKSNVQILDLACGTGLVGQALRAAGFQHVDGVDPSSVSLQKAEEKQSYRKLVCSYIGDEGHRLPFDDSSYDLVTLAGGMGMNMVPCNGLHEMVRLAKPGGYAVNIFREEILTNVPEYKDRLEPLMDLLETEKKWKRLRRDIWPEYQVDRVGIINVHQIL